MKRGELLEGAGLTTKDKLTPEGIKQATRFSLDEHLRPVVERLEEESHARKKAMAAGKMAKEKSKDKEKEGSSSSSSRRVTASENRQRVVKEVKAKLKLMKKEEDAKKGNSNKAKKEEDGDASKAKKDPKNEKADEAKDSKSSGNSSGETKNSSGSSNGEMKRESAVDSKEEKKLAVTTAKDATKTNAKSDDTKKETKKEEKASKFAATSLKDLIEMAVQGEIKLRFRTREQHERGDDPGSDDDNAPEEESTFRHLLYSAESIMERPGPSGEGPPVVTYPLSLHCLSRGTKEERTIQMWKAPKYCKAIKVGLHGVSSSFYRPLGTCTAFARLLSFLSEYGSTPYVGMSGQRSFSSNFPNFTASC